MRTYLQKPIVLFFLIFVQPSIAAEMRFESIPEQSKIQFTSHTKLFDVTGEFKKWTLIVQLSKPDPTAAKINVEIETKSVDTGIARRDKHLRSSDFFWVESFPKATFRSKKVTKKGKDQLNVEGTLQIRDKEKEIVIPLTLSKEKSEGKDRYRFRGAVKLNRMDFGIVYQSDLFFVPKILDDVDVTIDALLSER